MTSVEMDMLPIQKNKSSGANAERADKLLTKRIKLTNLDHLYSQLPQALMAQIVNSTIVAIVISNMVNRSILMAWLTAVTLVVALRYAAFTYYRKVPKSAVDYSKWRTAYLIGVIASASLWGATPFLAPSTFGSEDYAFLGFVLSGMAAGALGTMSGHERMFRTYILLSIVPFSFAMAMRGDTISYAMAALSLAFMAILSVSAVRNKALLVDALRLKYENADLLSELMEKASELKAANEALSAENATRQQTETALINAKQVAEAATLAKSQFLANMSHEIRTPMNGVFGMTDVLSRTELDGRQRKLVKTIAASARSLLTVINDILDLSRIEAGRLELDAHDFNLKETLESAVELFAGDAHRKGLDLTVFIDREVPTFVTADSGRLKQVVMNVIGNAIKFTPNGDVAMRVIKLTQAKTTSRIQIEIRDTGIGIEADVLEKLFKPFAQAETSITRRFGGTGLGLSIARHLVELMGGSILLKSTPGSGTVVTLEIPFQQAASAINQTDLDTSVLVGARVLVVDDRETNREIMADYLEAHGAVVTHASRSSEAWPALTAALAIGKPFHAAIVDMMMPEENGLQLAKQIKAHPELRCTKLILATSMTWHGDLADLKNAGIESTLTKPIRRVDLVEATSRAIEGMRHPGWRSENELKGLSAPAPTGIEQDVSLGLSILLAEDNAINVEVAKEFLSGWGCRIFIANNGLEAVAALASSPFDLVLMDCQMPVMDGLSASRRIRDLEKESGRNRVPIIAITANAFADDKTRCLEAGMDDYLSKPFTEQQLRSMLMKHSGSAPQLKAVADFAEAIDQPLQTFAPESINRSPAIDHGVLAPMRKARPDLLKRLIKTYLTHAPVALRELDSAAEARNFESLVSLAHTLKSSCGNLGATGMAKLCRKLETAAAGRAAVESDILVSALAVAYGQVETELQRIADSMAAPDNDRQTG